MIGHVDGAVLPGRHPAPGIFVLPKRCRADNGWFVDSLAFPAGVGMPVAGHVPERSSTRHGTFLGDVIFNKRVGRPPVDADKIVAATKNADIVVHRSSGPGIPAFAAHNVVDVAIADLKIAGVGSGLRKVMLPDPPSR